MKSWQRWHVIGGQGSKHRFRFPLLLDDCLLLGPFLGSPETSVGIVPHVGGGSSCGRSTGRPGPVQHGRTLLMPVLIVIKNDRRATTMGSLAMVVIAVLLVVMMNGPM